MVSFRFQVVAALVAAAAAVQANDHELEVRDWEERRLAPRNFELITTKLTLLVPKGSYKTVTKYKTVTVTGDCGGTTLTDPVPTPTDTFTIPPTPTDTGLPTDTLTTPIVDPTANATQPTTTFGVPAVNATIAAGGDPFAQTTPTLDIFGTSTDTVVVTITSDPTAPTPTAPSIVKRVAQVI